MIHTFAELLKSIDNAEAMSLFVFSGAGSGKTYTLVQILKHLKSKFGYKFNRQGKNIAVITYTNAAVNEIQNRMEYDSLFHVSTIHSFIWDCIKLYQKDIKRCYLQYLDNKIVELNGRIASMKRPQTKLAEKERLEMRKEEIAAVSTFTYSPDGGQKSKGALSHNVMLEIGSMLISNSKSLQNLMVGKYPYLLIDESQDTNKGIVSALLTLQKNNKDKINLILIGDQKQRIYADGQQDMASFISDDWETYSLRFNYRSDSRIVELSNRIAEALEKNTSQTAVKTDERGYVRLFLCGECNDVEVQESLEIKVADRMSEITGDEDWQFDKVKILTLEHRMAARRLKFEKFFSTLSKLDSYSMSFLRGEVGVMSIFKSLIVPLYEKRDDRYSILELIKHQTKFSSEGTSLKEERQHYREFLTCMNNAFDEDKSIYDVLAIVKTYDVYDLPSVLSDVITKKVNEDSASDELLAWRDIIDEPISSVLKYYDYVMDKTQYGTHQGVKGLEFDRVLGIIDDGNAGGFLFSYDKVFGAKDLSQTDIKNAEEGKETTIERTMRLLYVICTRARKSLALLMYTSSPDKAKQSAIEKGWFAEDEIEIMKGD